jgi:hypothetical protein
VAARAKAKNRKRFKLRGNSLPLSSGEGWGKVLREQSHQQLIALKVQHLNAQGNALGFLSN